jgi:hypothetical protein
MSDSINNKLSYLLQKKEQEIPNHFEGLNDILSEYQERIFDSLYINQEDFNSKI